jgi:PKD repeat protein
VPGGTANKLLYVGFIGSGGGNTNQPPVARFTWACTGAGLLPNQCAFDGGPSTDDVGVVQWAWSWGDGKGETKTAPTTRHGYAAPGTYTVTLTVTDGGGLTSVTSHQVTVGSSGNQAPTATISAPATNASFAQGASVAFSGGGSDAEDGALSGASLVWTSSIDGQIGTGTSFTKSNLSVGTHTITLTARDAQGATGTAAVTVTITGPAANQPPVARFTWTCTAAGLYPHQCAFDASTTTDDHGGVSYAWNWGDGRNETKTVPTTKNTWATSGNYTVTLTVTDAGGLTSSTSKVITVP